MELWEILFILLQQCFSKGMTKTQIRTLKSHYLSRWAVMRHNQKHDQKVLLITDQFVLKNLLPGSTLCYDCLGEMYQGIIPNLSTTTNTKIYNNLVLINNIEFKYKTLDQIAEYINLLTKAVLNPGGRVILSFEHRFLNYNRVAISNSSLISQWAKNLSNFKSLVILNLLGKSQPGYGDYFFCFEYQ